MALVRVSDDPFEPGGLLAAFSACRTTTGAIVSFTGLARAEPDETALELQAYPGFTDAVIAAQVEAAVARFALHDALVRHRTGLVHPGEAIVFVAVAAAHRRAAFEAADHLMDWLKSRAPFWKKAHGLAGAHWIEPTTADYQDAARWDQTHPARERPHV